jgi:hypothetical protein
MFVVLASFDLALKFALGQTIYEQTGVDFCVTLFGNTKTPNSLFSDMLLNF